MSLVERALDKMRGAQQAPDRRPAGPNALPATETQTIGALVESEVPEADGGRFRVHIDRAALRAAGYLPEADLDRRFADEYRQIKRPLLEAAFAPEAANTRPSPRLVMMASALPGDGKTFTSINLALSLARERDSSVVLVDADVAKPHISAIFGVQNQPGLLDALSDPTLDITSLILPTDSGGLSVLPAGRVRDGATELLASRRMGELTRQILARHPRCVALFDSPPLIVSSESRAVATAMGQVVLVVRAGQTSRDALLEAMDMLGRDRSVSLVLNQGRRSLTDGLYGYEYGTYGQAEKL
jgi:protein-tyrosine kinase